MGFGDEDDVAPSLSGNEAFTRSDGGKVAELKKKIKSELGSQQELKIQQAALKSQVNLRELKQELSGDKETKDKIRKENERQKAEKSHAPKTKSLKEKEKSEIAGAHDEPDADTIIERQEREDEISSEEVQREPG